MPLRMFQEKVLAKISGICQVPNLRNTTTTSAVITTTNIITTTTTIITTTTTTTTKMSRIPRGSYPSILGTIQHQDRQQHPFHLH